MEKFFCICEDCGSVEWIDDNGKGNSLEQEGEMLENQDIYLSDKLFCFECENPLKPISFNQIKKAQRKKIWKMGEKTRIKLVKSLKILNKIEKDNEKFR